MLSLPNEKSSKNAMYIPDGLQTTYICLLLSDKPTCNKGREVSQAGIPQRSATVTLVGAMWYTRQSLQTSQSIDSKPQHSPNDPSL